MSALWESGAAHETTIASTLFDHHRPTDALHHTLLFHGIDAAHQVASPILDTVDSLRSTNHATVPHQDDPDSVSTDVACDLRAAVNRGIDAHANRVSINDLPCVALVDELTDLLAGVNPFEA